MAWLVFFGRMGRACGQTFSSALYCMTARMEDSTEVLETGFSFPFALIHAKYAAVQN
jgi:hypothetical protein